ncbi:MAG: hypothetical protein JNM27_13070, partial [Leptospirales bacterium]|nr:hypothetical protein [Leptospirales bacterium]
MREAPNSFWAPTSLLVAGMFILLAAQLTWWIIFFRLNQDYVANLEKSLDRYKIQTAKKGALEPGIICNRDRSKCEIDPAAVQAREAVHRRQMLMLISETCFVLGVVGYGSFRVIRSVQREKQLSLERITFLNSVTHELKTPVAG